LGCIGKGTLKAGGPVSCSGCGGRGIKIQIRQMGPMIQQVQSYCNECGGKGEMIAEKDRCPECLGKKVMPETAVQEFAVERGMEWGQALVKRGEGDQQPGVEPGDLVVIIQEKADKEEYYNSFKRHGNDLILHQQITLNEALTGFRFHVKQLDGRILVISKTGEVVKTNDVFMVENEGMPKEGNPYIKGRLFVQFEVIFPTYKQISQKSGQLKNILPQAAPLKPLGKDEVSEDVDSQRVDFEQEKKKGRRSGNSDSEEESQGAQPCMQSIM